MDLSFLSELNLTKNEIKIYSAMFNLGSAASGRITHETGLHRSRVYEGLNRLIEKGLVSSIKKDNVTFFEATASEKILDYLEEERLKIEDKEKRIKKILPELEKFRETKPKAEAYILQGVEGFKAMRRDVLKYADKEHLLIGAIAREDSVMPIFFEKWNNERIKKKIKMKVLHKEGARGTYMTKLKLLKTRFLPQDISNPAVINIYGDRVVNVLWKDKYPLCFVMINKDIADSYKKYFELLWKIAKK